MRRLPTIILLLAALAMLAGCAVSSVTEQREAFAKRHRGPISVGVAWPVSAANDWFLEGVALAVAELNAGGGVLGRQLNVIIKDDESSVTKGLEIAQSFAEDVKVAAVIGHRNSYVSIPVSSIYERAGILMLSPASSAPEFISEKQQLVFRNIASDERVAMAVANHAARNGHRRMVILYDDDAYGKGLADAFEKHAGRSGVDIVDRLTFYTGPSELERLKFKWENLEYDGIFIAKSGLAGAQLIAELRAAGIGAPLFGGNALDTPNLWNVAGTKAAEGLVIGAFFNPESQREKVKSFIDTFTKAHGVMPTQYSAQGYDAVHLLAEAMNRARSTVPRDIAAALHTIENWEGVAGFHTFDWNGEDIGDLVVLKKATGGGFEYLNSGV
jgi:branched-chain amino acid transport system substrate-binding protein